MPPADEEATDPAAEAADPAAAGTGAPAATEPVRLSNHVLPGPAEHLPVPLTLVPAFWVLAAALVIGGWRLASLLHPVVVAYPHATIAAGILFGLYAIPFVLVVRSFDFLEQEPAGLLAAAFAWGGLVATTVAAAGGSAGHDLLAKEFSPTFASRWGAALVAPTLEEPVKLLGVVMIVLIAGHHLNSVVDGFVYGAFVGLGFQVVEDVVYALRQTANGTGHDAITPVLAQFLLRGVIGGLWSHTMFTALAGAGVGYLLVRREKSWEQRIGVAVLALLGAWALHFLWNSPWLIDGVGAGGWGVLAALLIKGAPAVVLVLVLGRVAGRQEAEHYTDLLAAEPATVCTAGERAALGSRRRRRAARRYALDRYGRRAAREVRYLQQAQAQLAVELSRGGPADDRLRARVLLSRARMRRTGHPEAAAPPGAVPPPWLLIFVSLAIVGMCALFVWALLAMGAG